ncbi:hypothetical protein BpHYR1_038473 [Brachionus plicatilis]|uniref:Uncharacterized protein n=1 Tax=Brachionus plicatilis TaxID=10195 RepID=A0A3M7RN85_BRAPC|nr:hypothetical protein BpHYR1_038473 [Brachionus plicatilis]
MVSNPYLIGFLFKQFCQSIFRHELDNILIPNSMLSELDTRQKQLMRCPLCKEVFHFSRESQATSAKKNASFCEQHKRLEKRLFINCLEYESKIVKALISFSFRSLKVGLVDSLIMTLDN